MAQPARTAPAQAITWRTDYTAARKEAAEKSLPLILIISTSDCYYCRKLEAGPLKDPAISSLIANQFIAIKVDSARVPELTKALKIQMYPTTVLAGPDGKIHAFIEGYLEAERYNDQLKRFITQLNTPDWAARDFNEASKALAESDYPRAVLLLKGITKAAGDKAVGVKATQLLDEIEKLAAAKLSHAKQLDLQGKTQDALAALGVVMKQFGGTQSAADAATQLAKMTEKPEIIAQRRARQARDLFAEAREDFRSGHLFECMLKCEQLTDGYSELPEAKEAGTLLADIKSNPERLAKACEQLNERTAAMYLTLADSWAKKGHVNESAACLQKVIALCPNTRHADIAQAELTKLQGKTPAMPTGLTRP